MMKVSSRYRGTVGLLLIALASGLAGCGARVEVPTASVARVMTSSGIEEKVHPTSTFRLPLNFLGTNPSQLIVIDVSDQQKKETLTVFMPKDKLIMDFELRATLRISEDPAKNTIIFTKQDAQVVEGNSRVTRVSFDKVYETYAYTEMVARSKQVVAKYDIPWVMSNRQAVGAEIQQVVSEALKSTPFEVIDLGLAAVQPPGVIIEAQAKAKALEELLNSAKADQVVALTNASNRLAVMREQQKIDLVQAETQLLVQQKLNSGVNAAYVTQRVMRALDALAESGNQIYIIPDQALNNPGLMEGLHTEAFLRLKDQDQNRNQNPNPSPK